MSIEYYIDHHNGYATRHNREPRSGAMLFFKFRDIFIVFIATIFRINISGVLDDVNNITPCQRFF